MTKATRKHVVQVVASLEVGGAERVAITLAAGLRNYGWKSSLVTLAGEAHDTSLTQPLRRDAEQQGVEVIGVPFTNIRDATSRQRLANHLKEAQVDLVHVHNRPIDWQVAILSKLYGVKALYTRHMVDPNLGLKARWTYRVSGRLMEKTVAVSQVVGDHLRRVEWLPESRIEVLYNGINTTRFRPPTTEERARKRAELGLRENDFLWFTALRLDPQKGLRFLLQAIRELPDNPDRKIFIAGDGPERDVLTELRQQLKIEDRIQFIGQRQDVAEILWATDACLCSSLGEGHPIALLEAMSVGLPIIAPRLAVIREVASEQTAYLYGPDQGELASHHEPTDIADAIIGLEKDADARLRIGKNARTHVVDSYSEDATLKAHSELYSQLLP